MSICKDNKLSLVVSFHATNLSKMEPTPALWALLLWTWRPVANRMPSFTVTERCENEAMSSSFQPGCKRKTEKPLHCLILYHLKFV